MIIQKTLNKSILDDCKKEIKQKYNNNVFFKTNPLLFIELIYALKTTANIEKDIKYIRLKQWLSTCYMQNDQRYSSHLSITDKIQLILNGIEHLPMKKCLRTTD